ncbi:MAG: protein kinase [Labilithrix sp.]|nr:protein kinase [Labilithrix sp.]
MDSTVRSGGGGFDGGGLPRLGETICGKYRVDSVVGAGGMGVVMGAVDTSLGRAVAIKFLAPHKASREGAVARFLREARAAAAIQSEHVVRVFEASTLPNGAPFIVMEHLRGVDLAQLLQRRGALPIDEACDFLLQACEALGEAHGLGIVHRDLKPQNLFLTQRPDGSPCVKVLDFGISKAVDEGPQNLTSTDTVMGTPLYMSPEQVRSLKNVDARSDIWALGSILFELLTLSPIFQAPSASALCAMIAMDPPTPLRARRPQAPAELEAVILRCLHKDPAGRWKDVAALADALVPFASERGRLSAMRVSRVVRSGTGPAPFGGGSAPPHSPMASPAALLALGMSTTGTGPTVGDPSRASFVPSTSGPPRMDPSLPPGAPSPTQNAWHQTHANTTAQKPATSSSVVVAVLGVLAGLVLLAMIGGGAWYFVARRDAAIATRPEVPDANAPGATVIPAPPSGPTASTAAVTTATVTAPSPSPSPAPTARRDGGAPTPDGGAPAQKDGGAPAQKDGGAPAPPGPTPDHDKAEAERLATLGRAAEAQCKNHRQQMTTFARDEATRKTAATRAKGFMCRGLAGSKCERQVCLEACLVLNDTNCIRDARYAIDHGPPPKY